MIVEEALKLITEAYEALFEGKEKCISVEDKSNNNSMEGTQKVDCEEEDTVNKELEASINEKDEYRELAMEGLIGIVKTKVEKGSASVDD